MKILDRDGLRVIHLTDTSEHDESIRLINSNEADGINFNYGANQPKDLNFLMDCPDLKYVQINSSSYDYSIINALTNLVGMSIYTDDRQEIRFDNFPKLNSVAIFWRPKAKSLFQCTQLKHLFLGKYTGSELSKLSKLTNLKYLRINTGSVNSLAGIECLQELEELWLMQVSKLNSLDGLQYLTKLKTLYVDNCKNITSAEEIKGLPMLKSTHFYGTTKVRL